MNQPFNDQGTALLAAARGMRAQVMELRHTFDKERRLPDALVRTMAEAGLFSLWMPRSLGGPELDPFDYIRVIEELAAADGSVGWCANIAATASRLAGHLELATAQRIFRGGRTIVAFTPVPRGKAIAVDGGYRVSGRW